MRNRISLIHVKNQEKVKAALNALNEKTSGVMDANA